MCLKKKKTLENIHTVIRCTYTQDNNLFLRIIHSSRTAIYRLSNTIVVREIYSLSALCHNYRRKASVTNSARSSRECWFTRCRSRKNRVERTRSMPRAVVEGSGGDLFTSLFRRCDILVCHPAVPASRCEQEMAPVRFVLSVLGCRAHAIDPRSTPMYTGIGSWSGRGRRARSWLIAFEIASALRELCTAASRPSRCIDIVALNESRNKQRLKFRFRTS